MSETTVKTPWIAHLGDVPATLDYFQGSMFEAVQKIAEEYPNYVAFDFMGKSTTYKELVKNIEQCARSLKTIGIRETLCPRYVLDRHFEEAQLGSDKVRVKVSSGFGVERKKYEYEDLAAIARRDNVSIADVLKR